MNQMGVSEVGTFRKAKKIYIDTHTNTHILYNVIYKYMRNILLKKKRDYLK